MPLVSMFGIGIIITVITAAGREHLFEIGMLLLLASFIHNILVYSVGYNAFRLFKLDEWSRRNIAFGVSGTVWVGKQAGLKNLLTLMLWGSACKQQASSRL